MYILLIQMDINIQFLEQCFPTFVVRNNATHLYGVEVEPAAPF